MKKYNNILIDENQEIDHPKTYYTKIYNQSHEIIGSVYQHVIYNLNKEPWGTISSTQTDKVREVFRDQQVIAKIYDNRMLLIEQDEKNTQDLDAYVYVGTIQKFTPVLYWSLGGILLGVIAVLILLLCYLPRCPKQRIPNISLEASSSLDQWKETEDHQISLFRVKNQNEESILYPGMVGSYQMTIKNKGNEDLIYEFEWKENNDCELPIGYTIQIDDEYIIGNEKEFVKIKDFSNVQLELKKKKTSTIMITYCWIEEDEKDINYANQDNTYKVIFAILYQAK